MSSNEDLEALRRAANDVSKMIGPWTDCPHCGADKFHQEVRNYDMNWHDGDVCCTKCGGYVRAWDAG